MNQKRNSPSSQNSLPHLLFPTRLLLLKRRNGVRKIKIDKIKTSSDEIRPKVHAILRRNVN